MNEDYTVDPIVSPLIQRKKEKEYNELERNIIENGAFSKITTWNQTVIDGLENYEICKRNMIPCRTYKIGFETWPQVYSWICEKQLQRTDLDPMRVKFLIGFFSVSEKSIEKGMNDLKVPPYKITSTTSIIAKSYNLSVACVTNYEYLAYRIFSINRYNPMLAEYILNGHLKISLSNIADLAKKNPDDFIHLQEMIEDKNSESEVRYIDLCPSLGWKPVPARTMNREEKEIPGIRKMPAYDPDAEIRSLSFTVPMWTNAIKRLCGSDSNHASLNAKNMLFESLDDLIKHSQELQDQLTRGYMNGQ